MKPSTENRAELARRLESRFGRKGVLRRRLKFHISVRSWRTLVAFMSTGKRIVDVLLALVLLFVFVLPGLTLFLLAWLIDRVPPVEIQERIGRWGEPFHLLRFREPRDDQRCPILRVIRALRLMWLPELINILKGEMSFVGPRPATPGSLSPREMVFCRRYEVRPGLISLWHVRRAGNIDFESEIEIDANYVETQSVKGDLGILARAVPAMLLGGVTRRASETIEMVGIRIDNLTMQEAIDRVVDFARGRTMRRVFFVNAHCVNQAFENAEYYEALRNADLVLADGIGVRLGAKLLRDEIKQNVNGTDMFPRLCEACAEKDLSIFLLGASPGVPDLVAENMLERYPKLKFAGVQHGYFPREEEHRVIERINQSGANLLLVAMGVPTQELWIERHRNDLQVGVAMGVGGLFDFYSGRIPRAPLWMREIGLEWVYRLIQEPERMWRRYTVGNVLFLWRMMRYRYVPLHGLRGRV